MASCLCWLVLMALAASGGSATTIAFEHSLDGGKSFVPAGSITLSLSARNGGTAVLERAPLSAEQLEQLDTLVAGNGLYRLRLPSNLQGAGSPTVGTSLPAHCLAAASVDGGLTLGLLDASHIASVALDAPCSRRAHATVADGLQLPTMQALQVRLPSQAPKVLQLLVPGQQAAAAAAAAAVGAAITTADAAIQEEQSQDQRGAGQQTESGKAGAGRQAKEEEKTWLQKNWMLLLPLVLIFMNVAGGANQPQRGGEGAPVRAVPVRR